MVEQQAFNLLVAGSSPARPTIYLSDDMQYMSVWSNGEGTVFLPPKMRVQVLPPTPSFCQRSRLARRGAHNVVGDGSIPSAGTTGTELVR